MVPNHDNYVGLCTYIPSFNGNSICYNIMSKPTCMRIQMEM